MQKISGHEYPLSKIFSEEFEFVIPSYQRPYAWTTDEAGELFDDLEECMADQGGAKAAEPYFLGSVVLIKQEGAPRAEVIDGQQRLTTLTLLLATLAERVSGDQSRALEKYINEPGDLVEEREPRPRLSLRDRDRAFFHRYVQTPGGLESLRGLKPNSMTDPQRNIRANTVLYHERLARMGEAEAFKLGRYIVNNCYLVAVSTPSMQSAYRIFSVMNDRGLDLLTSDILKADIIGKLPERRREEYTSKWEDMEESLGRDTFDDLFTHIRMIYQRAKLKTTVLDAFRDYVLEKEPDPAHLIDEVIVPYGECFQVLREADYRGSGEASAVNEMLTWLLRIDNVDWIPPAMMFMRRHREDTEALVQFLTHLERLAASMFIRRCSINERIERYGRVIGAIADGADLESEDSPLMLAEAETEQTIRVIDGDVYGANVRVRTYIMLRLDSFLSDRSAIYDNKVLTVEHVLPQTVRDGSYWAKAWPSEVDRLLWERRIGNLVLLSRRKNSQASNLDFKDKKERYFSTRGGGSPFVVTTKVLEHDEWTPEIVEARQGELLGRIKEGWDL